MAGMSINQMGIEQARREIAQAARAMLDGSLSFIEGARRILQLRLEARLPDFDPDIAPFSGIDSETDALPIGNRNIWSAEALARLQPEIERKERWAADFGAPHCLKLIDRFGAAGMER
jgi:hypothetical protein